MKPHKHAELIKAWADGAQIQLKGKWGWHDAVPPSWEDDTEYRIKPAKIVRWLWANQSIRDGNWYSSPMYMTQAEVDTMVKQGLIVAYKKLEWSREEFDE